MITLIYILILIYQADKHYMLLDMIFMLLMIKPYEIVKIPTGVKAIMEDDEVLLLRVSIMQGIKDNIKLCNHLGVIDKDYYNNINNEDHVWIAL